ncbi:FtsX-like permease family protein [Bacillus sp. WMMC1349]|uniref:FtsX-like permease family protein n=1 Tax=Bacillus sp. WMMC1349 TaxID=2736254 RepID=UPI001557D155|nr:ABC transporter permease [Bacillus sp. WMMC1349]NPC94255.1 FtsX-like permease family protein [Bacillus sp. WMMC1349]
MNMKVIARKNVQGNLQRYLAYFLSCVFTVSVFFIFSSFIYHPDVTEDKIYGGGAVKICLYAAEVIIIVFAIFFILYSNSAFLQARKKEFGLLSLFGTSKRQLKKMIYYEQTIISVLSIATGIGIGLLFSKLFFMAMTAMMDVKAPISFAVVPKALIITAVGFFILFQTLTILSLTRIRKLEIIDLLKAAKQPKGMPVYSKWLTALSLICLAGCYTLAATANIIDIIFRVFPILILVLIGTYFLFTQSSVAIFRNLYKHKTSFYRGTNLITRSNILFHLKDYARMLFLTSIITAVILTATGVIYMFYADLKKQGETSTPQAIGWVEKDASTYHVIKPDEVETALKDAKAEISYQIEVTGLPVSFQAKDSVMRKKVKINGLMISEESFNKAAEKKNLPLAHLKKGEAFISYPFSMGRPLFESGETATIKTKAGKPLTFIMGKERNQGILFSMGNTSKLVIVDQSTYDEQAKHVPLNKQTRVIGYELHHWENEIQVSKKLENMVPEKLKNSFQVRAPGYQIMKQATSLTLFIGLFISLVFFVVQGSLMYLRLFTEIEDTRIQVFALRRIGMTKKEIRAILGKQMGFLFFIPFVVGTIHAGFAYKALSNMLNSNLLFSAVIVIGIYFAFQAVYYLLTRKIYERAVLRNIDM